MASGKSKKKAARTLTQELSAFLSRTLAPDLVERARQPSIEAALRRRHEVERAAGRTSQDLEELRSATAVQVGAAWILSCVFVRTLEDRGLLSQRRIAGDGAADSEHLFFEIAPSLTARDYLLTVFREIGSLPGAEDLFGPARSPVWRLSLSADVARGLLDLFREIDDAGALRWTFAGQDTRFLGDLYQDLSEDVRKRYALLQTPRFVESFILDQTLEPAIGELGADEIRVLDPTCGSGHFLLGAFERLFEHRLRRAPGVDPKEHAGRALGQVWGVDVNPYAVAIARFRLTLAYLEKAGIDRLAHAPKLPLNLVIADSLLHGAKQTTRKLSELASDRQAWDDDILVLDDPEGAARVFDQRYHVVVGNPPYITCKDAALRNAYRQRYVSCHREYSLAAPFTERFFQLAADDGFVGMINANSFMKREFGKKLIEDVLPHLDLSRVVDTSGAYIPGHGTPTVILFGRNRPPQTSTVPAVLGKRGEPSTPEQPEKGVVWSSIAAHFDAVGFEDEYISVAEVPRTTLAKHPWSLGGGGAAELKALLEGRAERRLHQLVNEIGFVCMTRADDIYFAPHHSLRNAGIRDSQIIENVEGEVVRDWAIHEPNTTLFPYDPELRPVSEVCAPGVHRFLWPYRTILWLRREPNGNHREIGLTWWEWSRFQRDRFRTPLSIAFAFVATHNHFVLDRGGKVFKQSAPIIKLPEGATEEDHLALLGHLNSSTACFWMKQVCHSKGSQGVNEGLKSEAWEQFIELSGTALSKLPLPKMPTLTRIAEALDRLASSLTRDSIPPAAELDFREAEAEQRRAQMVLLQEELDWMVYELFGLLDARERDLHDRARAEALPSFPEQVDRCTSPIQARGLLAGHRAFEVVLAEDAIKSGRGTAWFERNGYALPSEITKTYAPALCRLIETRVSLIRKNRFLGLIERPEYKHRWTPLDFRGTARRAARGRILELLEKELAGRAEVRTIRDIATTAARQPELQEAIAVLGRAHDDPAALAIELAGQEAVPHLGALRYSPSGLTVRAAWERTWELQRREDAGEKMDIPVPPKYGREDYRDPVCWRLRGKLDVPKERFIAFPGAERDDDKSPLFGWAGWNHLERATALAALYQERKDRDGWGADRLAPLLAGLLELVPWLKQWHDEPSADYGGERLGDFYEQHVESEARSLGLSLEDLRSWRPEGRKGRARGGAES